MGPGGLGVLHTALGVGVSVFWTTATAMIHLLVVEEMRGRDAGFYMVT